jgi:RNA polymerase sigma-70 factor (ECF subfamily)
VELCRTAGTFDGSKGTAKLWILRCAYRRSLNRKRHLTYRKFYAQEEICEGVLNESGNERGVAPALSAQESRRLAHEMLNSLDSAQRQVVEMVYFEGLSLAEISAKTGDSAASVRHRYYRGIHKMRRLLRQQPDFAEGRVMEGKPVDADA